MRAVNFPYKNSGDDLFNNRLFSYLQTQLTITVDEITPIKNQVYLIKAGKRKFILKGFETYHRLVLQEMFISALKNVGFENTYSFYPLTKKPPLYFEHMYYGCLKFIESSKEEFSYDHHKKRVAGLELLSHFHFSTRRLVNRFHRIIPAFQQIEKWQERAAIFFNNLPIVRSFIQKEMITEILSWADWSLKGMLRESHLFNSGEKVILHGDVANHNFLRGKNNKLYLIDFDLISVGVPHIDYLQYANRILPFMNWSLEELANYEKIKPFLHEKGFIYALAYPTDIFREWNRAIKEGTYLHQEKIQQLLELTVVSFKARQDFFQHLQKAIFV